MPVCHHKTILDVTRNFMYFLSQHNILSLLDLCDFYLCHMPAEGCKSFIVSSVETQELIT